MVNDERHVSIQFTDSWTLNIGLEHGLAGSSLERLSCPGNIVDGEYQFVYVLWKRRLKPVAMKCSEQLLTDLFVRRTSTRKRRPL